MSEAPAPSTEDRVLELEVKVAFQEKLLSDLDDVIRALRAQVDALAEEVELLHEQLEPNKGPVVDEKPPHW